MACRLFCTQRALRNPYMEGERERGREKERGRERQRERERERERERGGGVTKTLLCDVWVREGGQWGGRLPLSDLVNISLLWVSLRIRLHY